MKPSEHLRFAIVSNTPIERDANYKLRTRAIKDIVKIQKFLLSLQEMYFGDDEVQDLIGKLYRIHELHVMIEEYESGQALMGTD